MTGLKEPFKPIKEGQVGIYTCGPTVYGSPHIGNLRAYIFSDTLRRVFEYFDYQVTQVVNITDVGHLSTDADEGEDKLEKGAKKTGQTVWEVARSYEKEFIDDLKFLNIEMPAKLPRATDHIKEQLTLIKTLTQKGFTYDTSDGIYFDTSKFSDYGKLGKQKIEEKESGARVEINAEKKHPSDFALWKFCVGDNLNHAMRWDFESGEDLSKNPHLSESENRGQKIGFPGWHIECSAMSAKYLGEQFDIHTGGIDHIAVHHENEIAQSEAAFGHSFVNYWMHNEFMTVDGGKMSKSLGNTYTLSDVISHNVDPLSFRYLCLMNHYRSKLNFTWEALTDAEKGLMNILSELEFLIKTRDVDSIISDKDFIASLENDFQSAVSDDLNTAKALAVFSSVLSASSVSAKDKLDLIYKFDKVLGFDLEDFSDIINGLDDNSFEIVPEDMRNIYDNLPDYDSVIEAIEERKIARKNKNFSEADAKRLFIESQGFKIRDISDNDSIIIAINPKQFLSAKRQLEDLRL